MDIKELIGMFQECEKVRRTDMEGCITDAVNNERFYAEAMNKLWLRLYELFPYKGDKDEKEAYKAYFDNYDKGSLHEWMELFKLEFRNKHGVLRTFDEACELAAEKWARKIFGTHVQYNGDQSETGGMTMVLGTLAKEKAKEGLKQGVDEKFKALMRDYYRGGCKYTDEKNTSTVVPYCDYGPNHALFDILVKAGVGEKDANFICPWKTGISIDTFDNSVCITGYQTAKYI